MDQAEVGSRKFLRQNFLRHEIVVSCFYVLNPIREKRKGNKSQKFHVKIFSSFL